MGAPHGLLLTGGRSRRMGRDKASLEVDGRPMAGSVAESLRQVAATALEVGPGRSGLAHVVERSPGAGPLGAVAAGWLELQRVTGQRRAVLVLACDLPDLTVEVLRWLAAYSCPPASGRKGAGGEEALDCSVVPMVGGRAQPLCARWSPWDLDRAAARFAVGERSLREAFGPDASFPAENEWSAVTSAQAFADLDTPSDLRRRTAGGMGGRQPA